MTMLSFLDPRKRSALGTGDVQPTTPEVKGRPTNQSEGWDIRKFLSRYSVTVTRTTMTLHHPESSHDAEITRSLILAELNSFIRIIESQAYYKGYQDGKRTE